MRCLYLTEDFILHATGDGLYFALDCYSLMLNDQMRCDGLYRALDYYSLLLNYQMRCLYLTTSPFLAVGTDIGFLRTLA